MLKSIANDQPPRPSLGGVRQIDHVAMCGSERSLYIRSLVISEDGLTRSESTGGKTGYQERGRSTEVCGCVWTPHKLREDDEEENNYVKMAKPLVHYPRPKPMADGKRRVSMRSDTSASARGSCAGRRRWCGRPPPCTGL